MSWKGPFPLLLAGLAALPRPGLGQGGPPLITDDPGTPGDGNWEVNLAMTFEGRPGERAFELPLADINYGAGERIQLKLEVPWVILDEEGEKARGGVGNPEVGVKWRVLDQEPHVADVSVYPQAAFNSPTSAAERGVVEEGTELFLPFELERGFGPFAVNPELGYLVREHGGNRVAYGLALGWEAAEGLELLGELHGEADDAFEDHDVVFNLGFRWDLVREIRLLFAAGRGLRGSRAGEPEVAVYAGVQLLF